MPLSADDPIVQAYTNTVARRGTTTPSAGTASTAFGKVGRFSPASTTTTRIPAAAAPGAPAAPASPGAAPTGPASTGEWTMPGITDPSWMAVSRGFQFNADTINQNAQRRREQFQSRADFERPQIAYEGELARRDTTNDAEGRGVLRSGEHERMLAEQMRKEQERMANLDLQLSENIGNVEMDTSTQLSDLRRQFAEKGQDAAYQQHVMEGTQQAQQAVLGGGPAADPPGAGNAGGLSLARNADGSVANGGLYFDGWAYYTMNNGVIKHIGDPAQVAAMQAAGIQAVPVQGDQIAYYRKATGLA